MNVYFGGASYGMIYYMGMFDEFRKLNINRIYGNSAGALSALLFICGFTSDDAKALFYKFVRIQNGIDLTKAHVDSLKLILSEHPNIYKNTNLYIGVTTPNGFIWKNTFESHVELVNTLLCSYHIPFLCSYDAKCEQQNAIDGGLGISLLKDLPEDTLTIGANNSSCKIDGGYPTLFMIVKPPETIADFYFYKGKYDIQNYFTRGIQAKNAFVMPSETSIPVEIWFMLRRIHPITVSYSDIQKQFKGSNS